MGYTHGLLACIGCQSFQQSNRDQFHYHLTVFSSQLKSKCGNILVETVLLRIIMKYWRSTCEVKITVKEYVNYVSIPEYGLDCQSRHSKSCVVSNGTLSTEVLRVDIVYRSTRSELFCLFGFRSKRMTEPTVIPEARVRPLLPTEWSRTHRPMLQDLHLKITHQSLFRITCWTSIPDHVVR